jgi:hypothetical protein
MFAAAERNNVIRKYCDVLDTIIETVMDHVERTSSKTSEVTGSNGLASPAFSPIETQVPPSVFETLQGLKIKIAKLDFPSRSYPSYCRDPEEWRKRSIDNWIPQDEEIPIDPDYGAQGEQFDFGGPFSETIDMSSMAYLFDGHYGE